MQNRCGSKTRCLLWIPLRLFQMGRGIHDIRRNIHSDKVVVEGRSSQKIINHPGFIKLPRFLPQSFPIPAFFLSIRRTCSAPKNTCLSRGLLWLICRELMLRGSLSHCCITCQSSSVHVAFYPLPEASLNLIIPICSNDESFVLLLILPILNSPRSLWLSILYY